MVIRKHYNNSQVYRFQKEWNENYKNNPHKDEMTHIERRKFLRASLHKITAKLDLHELEDLIEWAIGIRIQSEDRYQPLSTNTESEDEEA